jgi:HEAT repeat protein
MKHRSSTRTVQVCQRLLNRPSDDDGPNDRAIVSELKALGVAGERVLIAALSRPDPVAQRRAAEVLGELRSKRAVRPLIKLLDTAQITNDMSTAHAWSVADAAAALGKIGDQAARPSLLSLLRRCSPEEDYLSWYAIQALVEFGNLEVAEAVFPYLEHDDTDVQKVSCRTLAKCGRDAVPGLLSVFANKSSCGRIFAGKSLGLIGDAQAVAPFLAVLNDITEHEYFRADVARYAGVCRNSPLASDGAIANRLVLILTDEQEPEWLRRNAAEGLGLMRGLDALSLLRCFAHHKSWSIRAGVANAYGLIATRDVVEDLCDLLHDPQYEVLFGAIRAFQKIPDGRALPALTWLEYNLGERFMKDHLLRDIRNTKAVICQQR